MTPEERAETLDWDECTPACQLEGMIADAIRAAIEEERLDLATVFTDRIFQLEEGNAVDMVSDVEAEGVAWCRDHLLARSG